MTVLSPYRARYDADVVAGDVLAGDSDQAVADYYNEPEPLTDEQVMVTRDELRSAIDVDEFKALDAPTRDVLRMMVQSERIQLRGSQDRATLLQIFLDGSTTRDNLIALQAEIESRPGPSRAKAGGFLGHALAVSAVDTGDIRAMP